MKSSRWLWMGLTLGMIAWSVPGHVPSAFDLEAVRWPLVSLATAHTVLFLIWFMILRAEGLGPVSRRARPLRLFLLAGGFVAVWAACLAFTISVPVVWWRLGLLGSRHSLPGEGLELAFTFGDLFVAALLTITAGIFYRRHEVNRRMILLASIAVLGAPLAPMLAENPALAAVPPVIVLVPLVWLLMLRAARNHVLDRRVAVVTLGMGAGLFLSGAVQTAVLDPLVSWLTR